MANNNIINAVLALVEDRPKDAREILRGPDCRISSPELLTRLYTSLANRENKAIRSVISTVLQDTLKVNAKDVSDKLGVEWDEREEEAFLQGVVYVERILDFIASYNRN